MASIMGPLAATPSNTATPSGIMAIAPIVGRHDNFKDSPAYVVQTASDFVENSLLDVGASGPFGGSLRPVRPVAEEAPGAEAFDLRVMQEQPDETDIWEPSLFKEGAPFEQKHDIWQVKNTFLTFTPNVKPIRSVRTAEGALCSLVSDSP